MLDLKKLMLIMWKPKIMIYKKFKMKNNKNRNLLKRELKNLKSPN